MSRKGSRSSLKVNCISYAIIAVSKGIENYLPSCTAASSQKDFDFPLSRGQVASGRVYLKGILPASPPVALIWLHTSSGRPGR